MTVMLVCGAGIGLGLALLVVWVAPPRPALGPQLARLTTHTTTQPLPDVDGSRRIRVVEPVVGVLRSCGLPKASITRDLIVVERSIADYLTEKATLTVAGLLVPSLGALALSLVGVDLGMRVPVLVTVGCALAGFLIPDRRVRSRAAQRRTDFRYALSAFLDLVVISLAGGAGVDSALTDAAHAGHGWAFTLLRRSLDVARLTRTTPWTALRQLGRDLDIPEMAELAASVSLAGTEGAKVRHSLQAKASALRTRQLTETETREAANTEHLSLPVMALLFGFLSFLTYPAIDRVLTALS
jgi:Flp pilus assembly protein TadB